MRAMVADDAAKRDVVVRALNQMPGVRCAAPEGTINAWPGIAGTGRTGAELADLILDQAHVVVEAGSFYGRWGAIICASASDRNRYPGSRKRWAGSADC